MGWTDRQRRMLVELGIPPWLAPAGDPEPPVQAAAAVSATAQAIVAERRPHVGPVATQPMDAPAPAQAVAMLDWSGLSEAVAACTACGLCRTRTQTVFGVGHRSSDWMIVGEAPGEQEDLQGEPFVGRSGQLLDNMLLALGLTRGEATPDRQVYIANSLKCRPPGNRYPTPEEVVRCAPFLARQIALVRPRIILAMGRFAVLSLLHSSEPIGRLRGRVHQYQGVPLIVTYHPAYLLRHPQEKARAWDDLCLAAQTVSQIGADPAPAGAAPLSPAS